MGVFEGAFAVGVSGQHQLDGVEDLPADQRLVVALVDRAPVGDLSDVEGVAQQFAQGLHRERFLGQFGGGRGGQAARLELGGQ